MKRLHLLLLISNQHHYEYYMNVYLSLKQENILIYVCLSKIDYLRVCGSVFVFVYIYIYVYKYYILIFIIILCRF